VCVIGSRRAPPLDGRAAAGQVTPMLIFKVLTAEQWAALDREGSTAGAPVDLADGYVHLSTAAQLPGTLAKHFAGAQGLVLAAVDAEGVDDALKWEPSRGGDLFPHLYRRLFLADVLWMKPLPIGADGSHDIPPEARA
jgi:uncharacterized protein (DUF952 family)